MEAVKRSLLLARHVITPREILSEASVVIEGEKILSVTAGKPAGEDFGSVFRGEFLIPGMIDLQVNGCAGADSAEASEGALRKMSVRLAAGGVTSFLPTLISAPEKELMSRLGGLSEVIDEPFPGAKPLGVHLEGPFLNPERRGVHPAEAIQPPDIRLWERYWKAVGGRILLLTLAPEMEGAFRLIDVVRERGVVVSLGHSLSDYETAIRAFQAGAGLVTHLFNAMGPFHHRRPGLVGAALDDARVRVSLIADGVHLHPALFSILAKCKGRERLVLVSDSISAAGVGSAPRGGDGWYHLGNLPLQVRNGVSRTAAGRLAGSTLILDQAVRNLIQWGEGREDADLCGIIAMASLIPARTLGLKSKGRVEPGFDADLVLLGEQWNVLNTWRSGELVYDRGMW